MAPALKGSAAAAVTSANNVATPTTLNPTLPAHAAGDLLLCYTACRSGTPTVATPAGWTSLANIVGTNGRLVLFGKVAASGSESTPAVTWSSLTTGTSGTPVQAQCAVFTGMQALITGIADVLGTVENGAASTTVSASGTSITTLTADDLVLALTTRLDDAGTFTAPSGFTEIGEAGSTSGADMAFSWAFQVKATPGSVAPADFGLASAVSFASSGVLVALKAAPTPKTTGVAQISLASVGTPEARTAHAIKVRARVTAGPGTSTIRAALYQGATNRSGDLESSGLTTSLAEYTLAIPDASAANITDYSNLEIRLWGYNADGTARTFEVDQVWLELPIAAVVSTAYTRTPADTFGLTDARTVEIPPQVTTLIDDFNRANGAVHVGATAIWTSHDLSSSSPSQQVVSGNQLASSGTSGASSVSVAKLATDFDLIADCVVAPTANHNFYFCLTNTGVAAWNGVSIGFDVGSSGWWATEYTAGSGSSLGGRTVAAGPQAGERYWFAKRGTKITLYKSVSGGPWTQVCNPWTTSKPVGNFGTAFADTTTRWDNLLGGPLAGTAYTRTPSDTFGLTDARAKAVGKARTETFGLTDARTRTVTWHRSRADTFGLTDARRATHVVVKPDAFGLTDARTFIKGKSRTFGETFGLTDARARVAAFKRTVADVLGLTDTRRATHVVVKPDTFGLTDARTRVATYRRTRADGLALTDACSPVKTTGGVPRTRSVGDAFALTDSGSATWAANRSTDEQFGLTDVVTPVKTVGSHAWTRTVPDGFGLTDARTRTTQTKRTVADGFGLTDARRATHVVVKPDQFGLTDARVRSVGYRRSRADAFGLTDAESEARGKRISDAFGLTDAERETRGKRVSDTFGLTDARTRVTQTKRSVADTFGLTDARRATRIRAVADGFALTDARTRVVSYKRTPADAFGLTDARALARSIKRTRADTFGLTDAEREARGKSVSDTLGLTDQRTRSVTWHRSRADALGLIDGATPILTKVGQHTKLVPDLFGLTDTRARRLTWHRTLSDAYGLTDQRALARAIRRSRADTFGLTDAEWEARGKRITDTLGLTDQRTRTVTYHRTVAEAFALTDARVLFKGKRVTLSDAFGLTDARSRIVTWHRAQADALGLTDTRTRTVTWHRSRADALGLTDQTTRARAIRRTRADTFGLTDLATPQKTTGSINWTRSVADSITFTDTRAAVHVVRVTDAFALTDARTRTVTFHRSRTDTLGLTDARLRAVTWHRSRADTFGLTDQAQVAKSKKRALADTLAFTDARTRAVAWHRTRADGITFTDTPARARGSVLTVADSFAFTDALTKGARYVRTLDDAFMFTDRLLGIRIPVGLTLVMPYAIRPLTTQPLDAEIVYRVTDAEQVERDTAAEGGSKLVAVL